MQYPDSEISIESTKTYGTEDYIADFAKERNIKAQGRRPGSQSSRLVRTKVIIKLDNEKLELVVFPLLSTGEKAKKYWAWLETRLDDGRYVRERMFAAKNGIPSLYDLLYPPPLYREIYQATKKHSVFHN